MKNSHFFITGKVAYSTHGHRVITKHTFTEVLNPVDKANSTRVFDRCHWGMCLKETGKGD